VAHSDRYTWDSAWPMDREAGMRMQGGCLGGRGGAEAGAAGVKVS
jgi:hypothetical protein